MEPSKISANHYFEERKKGGKGKGPQGRRERKEEGVCKVRMQTITR